MSACKNVENTVASEIQVFQNEEFGNVRSVMTDMTPWFVGKDVATALGYSNASKAIIAHVDEEDKRFEMLTVSSDSQNGNLMAKSVKTALINESGMYALIFGSKLESAKRFKRWVTSEVLPSIRETGGYSIQSKKEVQVQRQARFDVMVEKLDELTAAQQKLTDAHKQDRQAIDNVLYVCKQLSQQVQALQAQNGSFTPRKNPKGQSEWRTELYETVNKIARLTGLTVNAVMKQGYDYMGRNYGWFFKDARKEYVEKFGWKGDISNLSGVDIIEASDMYRSIFMSIMKDRLENEKEAAETKKGIVSSLVKSKHPAPIPLEVIPARHKIEESVKNAAAEVPVVVAEAQAIEVVEAEKPATEMKPKRSSYTPSVLKPIVDPIAEKLGDNSWGHQQTYRKIYEIVGVNKIDRLTRKYTREHNKPPKSKAVLFMMSDKALKIFEAAAKELAATV